jgi:Tol biopolymer transport system component
MENIRRSRAVPILAALLAAVVALTLVWDDPAEARKKKKRRWAERIVFTSNRSIDPEDPLTTDREIFSIKPDGTGLKQLTANSVLDDGPVISPNGTKIAYSSQDPRGNVEGDREIFVMNTDGSKKTNVTNTPAGVEDFTPDFSPDGKKIAFTRGDLSASDIYFTNVDGTGTFAFIDDESWPEFRPVFSPDGQRIAFTSLDTLSPNDFEIFDASVSDGSSWQNLTANETQDYRPEYSPDGRKIYYDSAGPGPLNGDGDFDVMVMNFDGSAPANLTEESLLDDLRPSVRRSGTQIVFERLKPPATTNPRSTPRDKEGELWIMDATTGSLNNSAPLTDTGFAVINQLPDWGRVRS